MFFHLCQFVCHKIKKKNGLVRQYGRDETFSSLIRRIPCLAFLEHTEIPKAFTEWVKTFSSDWMILMILFDGLRSII